MKTKATLLFWTLILFACSPGIFAPQTLPAPDPTNTSRPSAIDTVTAVTPSITECGYQWAYEDLPALTAQFDQAIKNLISNSASRATAFGENCVAPDGQVVRFLAMETDFHVTVVVQTLNDYDTLGNWIAQVMQVVIGFPPELIVGPKPGFVEFRFKKSSTESIGFRIPIQQYIETADGKSGEELFRMFYAEP